MRDLSFSLRVARTFIQSYKDNHPADEVETLDLWEESLPPFDFTAASGKYKTMHQKPRAEEEEKAWQRIVAVAEHFKGADKYLLSVPMWNFSIPYRLKQYLDIIIQPGILFSYDPQKGYSGLVTGRPLQMVLARGGEYSADAGAGALDFQLSYLQGIFRFIGFVDIRTIIVEPTLLKGPEVAAQRLAGAEIVARKMARDY
jgi:FMN-dependent NADH-azoreductase